MKKDRSVTFRGQGWFSAEFVGNLGVTRSVQV